MKQGVLFLSFVCSCGWVAVSCIVIKYSPLPYSSDGSSVLREGDFGHHFVLSSRNSGMGGGFPGYTAT